MSNLYATRCRRPLFQLLGNEHGLFFDTRHALWYNIDNESIFHVFAARGGWVTNYTSGDFNVLSNVSARGGARAGGGSCGTVYFKQPGQRGTLRIVSHGALVGAWTPLGTPNDSTVVLEDLFCSGRNVLVMPEHNLLVRADNLIVTNGAALSHRTATADADFSLRLDVQNELRIATDARIDVSARGPCCMLRPRQH